MPCKGLCLLLLATVACHAVDSDLDENIFVQRLVSAKWDDTWDGDFDNDGEAEWLSDAAYVDWLEEDDEAVWEARYAKAEEEAEALGIPRRWQAYNATEIKPYWKMMTPSQKYLWQRRRGKLANLYFMNRTQVIKIWTDLNLFDRNFWRSKHLDGVDPEEDPGIKAFRQKQIEAARNQVPKDWQQLDVTQIEKYWSRMPLRMKFQWRRYQMVKLRGGKNMTDEEAYEMVKCPEGWKGEKPSQLKKVEVHGLVSKKTAAEMALPPVPEVDAHDPNWLLKSGGSLDAPDHIPEPGAPIQQRPVPGE